MARKILVVDDTRNVQVMLRDFLSGQDFEVLEAYDGREALEVVRDSAPDLVLLDIMMPNMDGYQFITQLRRASSIPVMCARKSCQMAKGRAARRWHRECQSPLNQAQRALAV